MIGYITIGTNKFDEALNFYTQLMALVDDSLLWQTDNMAAWAKSRNETALCIAKPHNLEKASVGNGSMTAIKVSSAKMVDLVHAKAISLGGTCEGAPGPRGTNGFYGAYFRDLDGNKLNAYTPATKA